MVVARTQWPEKLDRVLTPLRFDLPLSLFLSLAFIYTERRGSYPFFYRPLLDLTTPAAALSTFVLLFPRAGIRFTLKRDARRMNLSSPKFHRSLPSSFLFPPLRFLYSFVCTVLAMYIHSVGSELIGGVIALLAVLLSMSI